jgi:hypothetical protein
VEIVTIFQKDSIVHDNFIKVINQKYLVDEPVFPPDGSMWLKGKHNGALIVNVTFFQEGDIFSWRSVSLLVKSQSNILTQKRSCLTKPCDCAILTPVSEKPETMIY